MKRPAWGMRALAACGALACAPKAAPEAPTHANLARAPTAAASATPAMPPAAPDVPRLDAESGLVLTAPARHYATTYDNALVILAQTQAGRRAEAASVLRALAAVQAEDGGVPFSFEVPYDPHVAPYVRAGAVAWAGYAALVYLDADQAGPARDVAIRFAHQAASWLLARQVRAEKDARDGLVRGGFGTYHYVVMPDKVEQVFAAETVEWTSTEHNIDAYFFLRELGRMTGEKRYVAGADAIAAALTRLWEANAGQFGRGATREGVDPVLALDCASWGALFWLAQGDRTRAETSFAVADARFRSAVRKGARGHKPYAHTPIYEDARAGAFFAKELGVTGWDELAGVWPEGSAGVALAALRLGDRDRAQAILGELDALATDTKGYGPPLSLFPRALPTFSRTIPFEFDTAPSVAGSVWAGLVASEAKTGRRILFR